MPPSKPTAPRCRACKHPALAHRSQNRGLPGKLGECLPLLKGGARRGRCECAGYDPPPPRPPCPLGVAAHNRGKAPLCHCVPGQIALEEALP